LGCTVVQLWAPGLSFGKNTDLGTLTKKNPRTMKSAKEQLPPVIETGTLGCLAMAAIPRSTTELKKLVDDNLLDL
jgi:hypothetical protein